MVVIYGLGRVLMMVLNQIRDLFFTKVGQHAVRQLNNRTFEHLHRLSLRFHLERRTGGLSRVIERAARAIELIIRMGLLQLIPTILELVGAAAGGDYWLKPLESLRSTTVGAPATEQHAEFKRVKSLGDLEETLAANGGRVTMFDYYADWCVECVRMERTTFADPGVLEHMEKIQLLQADVTANDETDQALMRFTDLGLAIPGLLLAASYAFYIIIRCLIQPELGPALPPEQRAMPITRKNSCLG